MEERGSPKMMPIAPLMIEHRLIERMVRVLQGEMHRIQQVGQADPLLIERAVDFFRTYADRCHHGKEEGILFRELGRRRLAPEDQTMMDELVRDHVRARQMVQDLMMARGQYLRGEAGALERMGGLLRELVELYPGHIEREDRHFFIPVMRYFSKGEQEALLAESWEFDRRMIHERYTVMVEELEGAL